MRYGLLPLLALLLIGCPSRQAVERATTIDSTELPLDTTIYREGFPWGIRPGSCRLTATLVRVDSIWRSENPRDPCSAQPCRAWVRVDSVLGCGDGVDDPLRARDTVLLSFTTTLGDTRGLQLGTRTVYPGLSQGDRFGADVMYLLTPGSSAPRTDGSLTVYGYSRLSQGGGR